MILDQDFYQRDTKKVALDLLGKVLNIRHERKILQARIVEVEAYLGAEDLACHTFGFRKTERTKSMYLEGGHSYVYMIYGMYYCLNFVTQDTEHPEAVLIRAVAPLPLDPHLKKKHLETNGPGKLCRFYGIDKNHDGLKLWKKSSDLFVTDANFKVSSRNIEARPRIGVDYAGEAAQWPLRFYLKDNLYVSKK